MKKFKDSANSNSVAKKIVTGFNYDGDNVDNFTKSLMSYKDDVYSLTKKPSGMLELGVYPNKIKIKYTPIKEFNNFDKDKITEAVDSYLSKRVTDSINDINNPCSTFNPALLVQALADEFIAYWQYRSLEDFIVGNDADSVKKLFSENAEDELNDHAKQLLSRLNQLKCPIGTVYDIIALISQASAPQVAFQGAEPSSCVAINIKAEVTAINTYRYIYEQALICKDPVTADMIKHILADEEEHLSELTDLYRGLTGNVEITVEQVVDLCVDETVKNSIASGSDIIVADGKVWTPVPNRIYDMTKEEQTDEVKTELYKLTQQFVRKYWRIYYPRFKGDIDDLISDFYIQFLTPKSRVKGKEESLLDKYNPKTTSLPYLVQVAVKRMLIDRSRTDKNELNYAEKYDEETGDLTLDFLASKTDEGEIPVDDITFSEDDIFYLRDLYDELTEAQRKHFLRMYKECKNVLSDNFKELFKDLVGY